MSDMITEDYVSFETAKLLKEKGFDEGRRLEREDSVECEVTDVGLNFLDLALFEAERLGLNKGDKVKVIVLKEDN